MRKAGEIADFELHTDDPDSIHFALAHPGDGRALRYHFDEFMIGLVPRLARRLTDAAPLAEWRHYLGGEMLDLYVEQALYLELLQPARALFRRDFAAGRGWSWNSPVPVIPELASLVGGHWPGPARTTVVSSPLVAGMRALNRLRRSIAGQRDRLLGGRAHQHHWTRPMIAVELGEGIDPDGKNDAFWLADGAVDPARAIFILERHNLPFLDVPRSIRHARKVGAAIVATDAPLARQYGLPFWAPAAPRAPACDMPPLPRSARPADRHRHAWLSRILGDGGRRVQYWERFFRSHNVAVYQHFTELSTEAVLRRVAARRAGAVEVGRMRSQFFEPTAAAFHFQHQVAMVWNRDVADVLAASRTRTGCLLETGYPYDYLLHRRPETLPAVDASRDRVACVVFDNHSHYDNHFTRQDLAAFYLAVIQVAERRPQVSLVVKSKKSRILDALPEVRARLDDLVRQGRCSIVSGRAESAAGNSLGAQIAVGIPGSTAVCEAALMGCAALMYDPSGASRFAAAAAAGIVCRDVDRFREQLDRLVQAPAADRAQEEFRLSIAPRAPEGAHVRAAKFLNACLHAREAGASGDEMLASALAACGDYAIRLPAVPAASVAVQAVEGQPA